MNHTILTYLVGFVLSTAGSNDLKEITDNYQMHVSDILDCDKKMVLNNLECNRKLVLKNLECNRKLVINNFDSEKSLRGILKIDKKEKSVFNSKNITWNDNIQYYEEVEDKEEIEEKVIHNSCEGFFNKIFSIWTYLKNMFLTPVNTEDEIDSEEIIIISDVF